MTPSQILLLFNEVFQNIYNNYSEIKEQKPMHLNETKQWSNKRNHSKMKMQGAIEDSEIFTKRINQCTKIYV